MAFKNWKKMYNYKSLVTTSQNNWTISGVSNEYMYNLSDLSSKPFYVYMNGLECVEGVVGSLTTNQWGWDKNSSKLYIYSSTDPDNEESGYIKVNLMSTVINNTNSEIVIFAFDITNGDLNNAEVSLYIENSSVKYYLLKKLAISSNETVLRDAKLTLSNGDLLILESNHENVSIIISGMEK